MHNPAIPHHAICKGKGRKQVEKITLINRNVDLEMNPPPPSIHIQIQIADLPTRKKRNPNHAQHEKAAPKARCHVSKCEEETKPSDPQFCQFSIPKKAAVSG